MRPALTDPALAEAEEARAWYAAQSLRAAERFAAALEHALEEIAQHPLRWQRISHRHRRFVMERFPYSIVYQVLADGPVVIAIAHQHRRPGYWRGRR